MSADLATFARVAGLEPGEVVVWGFLIVGYIGEDGQPHYAFANRGDARTSEVIGHLEMAKVDMINQTFEEDDLRG